MNKNILVELGLAVDNEFLDKYCQLFNDNTIIAENQQKHHFIPVYYYKNKYKLGRKSVEKIANEDINNEIKSVSIKNHILLHYYLEKCSTTQYKGKNIFSIYCLLGKKYSKDDLLKILDDESILYDFLSMLDGNYLFTAEHLKNLKLSAKNRKSSTGNNISKTGYVGGVTGLKMIYDVHGNRRYIDKDSIDEYLLKGWTLPTNKKKTDNINNTTQKHTYIRHKDQAEVHKNLSLSHIGISPANKGIPRTEETKEKLSKAISGRVWINNGLDRKQIKKEELDLYINLGYSKGFGKLKTNGGDVNEVN